MVDVFLLPQQAELFSPGRDQVTDPWREGWHLRAREVQIILENVDQSAADTLADVLERMI